MVNLQTSDVALAKRKRDDLEAATTVQFREIRRGLRTALDLPWDTPTVPLPIALGPAQRGALARQAIADAEMEDNDELAEVAAYAAEAEADRLNPLQRKAFDNAFTGRVEIDHHLGEFLSVADLAPETRSERRGLVLRLAEWCRDKGVTLDRVDRKVAGRYVSDVIDPMHSATASKHLTALRMYWKHLAKRGHIQLPYGESLRSGWPWNEQQPERKGKRVERGDKAKTERPFTSDEIRRLLYSPWPMRPEWEELIRDALKISLLSGMRLAEVLTLWAEEVHDGVFDIQQGKTEAAARQVPIHPDLKDIVERRLKGKSASDWLFHELQNQRDAADTFGKRFNRSRVAVDVDDKREGVRRSLVNFHSARRWFITEARHAGQMKETIASVVGHKPDKRDVTFRVYAKTASDQQLRDCVGAVQLPERVPD